jgi:hypothetical protein
VIFQQHWTRGRVVGISDLVSNILSMIAGNAVTVMVRWLLVVDEESYIGARRVGTLDELKIFGGLGVRDSEIGIWKKLLLGHRGNCKAEVAG